MMPREAKGRASWVGAIDLRCPFGPTFFLAELSGLVRDRCPDPDEGLPVVQLHLMDGQILDVCHIIGVAPGWVALAVHDAERHAGGSAMRTELVPYTMIARVTIHAARHEAGHIGFELGHEPSEIAGPAPTAAMSPEEALKAVAGPVPAPTKERTVE